MRGICPRTPKIAFGICLLLAILGGQMPSQFQEAPLFTHARRELSWTLTAWAVCGLWVVGVSWWGGTRTEEEGLRLVLGFPAWVFWGVGLPWLAANVFTFWFCFRCMADDPLDEVAGESGPEPVERDACR